MNKKDLSILAGLVLAVILTACADISHTAENIKNSTLRLHIIANSDSDTDQQIKMAVKEKISDVCSEILCPAESLRQAVQLAEDNMDFIEKTADHTLQNLGAGYTAQCSVENFYFDTTEYTTFTMPAGNYTALTVRLGNAEGKNWWCVAYPSLCTSMRAEYEDDDSNTFIETDNFRIKFKIVEIGQKIKRIFDSKNPQYTNIRP